MVRRWSGERGPRNALQLLQHTRALIVRQAKQDLLGRREVLELRVREVPASMPFLQVEGRGDSLETDAATRIQAMRERVESALQFGQQLEI